MFVQMPIESAYPPSFEFRAADTPIVLLLRRDNRKITGTGTSG